MRVIESVSVSVSVVVGVHVRVAALQWPGTGCSVVREWGGCCRWTGAGGAVRGEGEEPGTGRQHKRRGAQGG